jgi:hypothetical protein
MKLKYVILTVLVLVTLCGECDNGFTVYIPGVGTSHFSNSLWSESITGITKEADSIHIYLSISPHLTIQTYKFEKGPATKDGKGFSTQLTLKPSEGEETVFLLDFKNPLCYLNDSRTAGRFSRYRCNSAEGW